jgi:prolyl oligopeptidase
MKSIILILAALSIMSIEQQAIADDNDNLLKIFSEYDEYGKRNYPEGATYDGDHRYDDKVTDNSEAGILARDDSTRNFLAKLTQINYDALSDDNRINYDLFKRSLEESLEFSRFKDYLMPIGQQNGIHIGAPQLVQFQPLSTAEDYNKYFARLRSISTSVDNDIANMRNGMSLGIVMPYFIMEQTLPQMESIISKNPGESIFFSAMEKGKDLSPEQRESISNELKEIISQDINPAFQRLHDFVKNEYLPVCRQEAGVWSLPDGADRYNLLVKYFTTLDVTFDDVHQTGLSEVARIEKEMNRIKDSIGFNGSVQEFNEFIKKDPKMFYTDKEDLMNGFREILGKMDTKLPELFGRLPKAPYDLKEMEEFRSKSAPAAYYYSAPEDRSRPGYFYVNTYDLPSRPKYTMTALALHEAVPGHHLQIAIAQELKNLPKFRRDGGYTSFVEGWALYAESLGYETQMYEDLYQLYGALIFEMWRACRLVVDTGIHAKKWTREEAVAYMKKYTANSDLDIKSEVDRYIAWPGQALAYKTGEMKIKELRRKSEEALGSKFDIKEFHDTMLKNGALPLPLLEVEINRWIQTKLGS